MTTPNLAPPKLKAPAIVEEGFRQRRNDITGWMCVSCQKHVTLLALNGGCANCGRTDNLYPVKTRERLKSETEAALDKQRFQKLQKEYDPHDPLSQMGKPLTLDQLLTLLRRFIPGTVALPVFNMLGRKVMSLYVPDRGKQEVKVFLTEYEQKNNLRFVCNCEDGIMPEWDVLQRNDQGLPTGLMRGWRSVLGTFYRDGLLPHIPDEGNRLSYYQIRESRKQETTF